MKETTENNILLAEFLDMLTTDSGGNIKEDVNSFKFHTSWDWLMLVVDKIENLENVFAFCIRFDKYTKQTRVEIHPYRNSFIKVEAYKKSKIEATYNACIKFVKWCNENKSK